MKPLPFHSLEGHTHRKQIPQWHRVVRRAMTRCCFRQADCGDYRGSGVRASPDPLTTRKFHTDFKFRVPHYFLEMILSGREFYLDL